MRFGFDEIFNVSDCGPLKSFAHDVGVTLACVYSWRRNGIPSCALKKLPPNIQAIKNISEIKGACVDTRADRMTHLYKHGATLEEVGAEFGLTRERVRQILKINGITRDDGGASIKSFLKARYSKKPDVFLPHYGCYRSEAKSINDGLGLSKCGMKAYRFYEHLKNSKARGIEFELTFPEWWKIWDESGKWELRGRGKGYCMARIGDTGGYSVDNVEIITIGQNFSDSYFKHPWKERFSNHGAKTHCIRGHARTPDNLTTHSACKLCAKERYKSRKATN